MIDRKRVLPRAHRSSRYHSEMIIKSYEAPKKSWLPESGEDSGQTSPSRVDELLKKAQWCQDQKNRLFHSIATFKQENKALTTKYKELSVESATQRAKIAELKAELEQFITAHLPRQSISKLIKPPHLFQSPPRRKLRFSTPHSPGPSRKGPAFASPAFSESNAK